MYLSRIEIENFRGIKTARIDLNETTLLIGENNSGKSAILEAVCKVLSIQRNSKPFVIQAHEFHQVKTGGQYVPAGDIRIALTFRERHPTEWSGLQSNEMGLNLPDDKDVIQELTIEITASPGEEHITPNWRIIIPGIKTDELSNDPSVLEWIRRMNPVFRIRSGIMTSIPDIPESRPENPKEPVISTEDFARRIQDHFEKLMKGIMPDYHSELQAGYRAAMNYLNEATGLFLPEGYREQNIIGEILGKQNPASYKNSRDIRFRHGSAAEMIGMLLFTTAILQSGTQLIDESSEPVFIFEDPEANLHPMTLESVRLLIDRIKWQKIITTQSGEFLSGYSMQDIRRITRRNRVVTQHFMEQGSLSGQDLRRLSYHIRMRRSTAIFARCWLLVEGESEVWLIPHLARLCGYDLALEGVVCVEFAQCGIAALVKAARQLGIEWFLLADGDAAGKVYAEAAKTFARQHDEDPSDRILRLREKDIEHHLFYNGYDNIYYEYADMSIQKGQNPKTRRVIERAVHRNSKPFMAIAVVEAITRDGSPGVPPVLKKLIETCVKLARKSQ
jgi:putative ATP-dependent endonuclease of the OLD family